MPSQPAPREAELDLLSRAQAAVAAADALLDDALRSVRARVGTGGPPLDGLLDREQRATHALAWLATYVEAVRQLCAYAQRMQSSGRLGEIEGLIVALGLGEYLAQMEGGIPMSQGEIARPSDMGLAVGAVERRLAPCVDAFAHGNVQRRPAGRADAALGSGNRRGLRA